MSDMSSIDMPELNHTLPVLVAILMQENTVESLFQINSTHL